MKPSALLLATCAENQGVKAVISVAVMFFLSTLIVAIRFYVRLVMLHGATGWDDYFILGSLVSFIFTLGSPFGRSWSCSSNQAQGLRRCYVRLIRQTIYGGNGKTHLLPTLWTDPRPLQVGSSIPGWRNHKSWPHEDLRLSLCIESRGQSSEGYCKGPLVSDTFCCFDPHNTSHSVRYPMQAPRGSLEYKSERPVLFYAHSLHDCVPKLW